jgi:hypothetical protein
MNRIKLLYDVMKTIKTKEILTWMLNDFEENLSTGQIKIKMTASVDYEGIMTGINNIPGLWKGETYAS